MQVSHLPPLFLSWACLHASTHTHACIFLFHKSFGYINVKGQQWCRYFWLQIVSPLLMQKSLELCIFNIYISLHSGSLFNDCKTIKATQKIKKSSSAKDYISSEMICHIYTISIKTWRYRILRHKVKTQVLLGTKTYAWRNMCI